MPGRSTLTLVLDKDDSGSGCGGGGGQDGFLGKLLIDMTTEVS